VGATPADDLKDGLPKRRDLSALDRLRVQLLGKKAAGKVATKGSSLVPHLTVQKVVAKPLPSRKKPKQSDSEDEEDGRASAVLSKTSRPRKNGHRKSRMVVEDVFQPEKKESDGLGTGTPETEQVEPEATMKSQSRLESKRKASSFLDEVLAEKARKKKKKKTKITQI
jgi:hypothetical protein